MTIRSNVVIADCFVSITPPPDRVFAQMQGGKPGTRPFTPVTTKAEMDKFDRSVLSYLRTTQVGGRPPTQSIDFDAFERGWNSDVDEEERLVRAGLLEVDQTNLVSRKNAADLQHFMVQSRKTVNMKRTMEPVLEATAMLRKSQRVHVGQPGDFSPGTDQGPSVGVLQDGSKLVFPSGVGAAGIRPRPRPLPAPFSVPSGDNGGGGGQPRAR